MHGSRALALEFLRPLFQPKMRVLDVCCGTSCWLKPVVEEAGASWTGIDRCSVVERFQIQQDISRTPWNFNDGAFDLAVSCYGVQHLLAREAIAWTEARRVATKFAVIGRFIYGGAGREMNRQDPLNGYNWASLTGLALATGWRVAEFKLWAYEGDAFAPDHYLTTDTKTNAFTALMEPLE